jgi:hypothetical protein
VPMCAQGRYKLVSRFGFGSANPTHRPFSVLLELISFWHW